MSAHKHPHPSQHADGQETVTSPAAADEPSAPEAVTAGTDAQDAGSAQAGVDGGSPLETLRAELAEATQKAEEYLDLLKRTRADFTNYRRRMDEERAQATRDAAVDLVVKLLPLLDDFERAVGSASADDLETPWGKGVQLIERNFRSLLAAQEVERIEAEGARFDPWQHEGVSYQPSAEVPEGQVLHVVRPGYRKGEKVIRPAQVVVAAAPE